MKTSLPRWDDLYAASKAGEILDPVEQFILDNEPAGVEHEIEFRKGLAAALDFVAAHGAPCG